MVNNLSPQYNHFLYVLIPGEVSRDENGDYEVGKSAWKLWGACREETNGRGAYVHTADKGIYQYSALIQLPVDTEYIADGTEILIANSELELDGLSRDEIAELIRTGDVRIIGTSAKFDIGRLHCRLWL